METIEIRDKMDEVRKEKRTKKNPWKQRELKKMFGNVPIRQPTDETIVFKAEASLGRLWIRNNSIGFAYEARVWAGYTIEVDGDKLENPQLMLLEIEMSKLKSADLRCDATKLRTTFTVRADARRKIIFIAKGKPGSD